MISDLFHLRPSCPWLRFMESNAMWILCILNFLVRNILLQYKCMYICNYKIIIYSNFKNCLYDGVAGLCCNTAGIVHVPSHLDVSLLAPGHPPAILHNPVVLQTRHINNTIQHHSPPLWIVILHSLTLHNGLCIECNIR